MTTETWTYDSKTRVHTFQQPVHSTVITITPYLDETLNWPCWLVELSRHTPRGATTIKVRAFQDARVSIQTLRDHALYALGRF